MTTRFKMPPTQLLRKAISVSSSMSLLVWLSVPAQADYVPVGNNDQLGDRVRSTIGGSRAYTPPPGSRSSGQDHTGGGVRGCGDEMIALAPVYSLVGQAQNPRPTFVWYIDGEGGMPLELSLYRYGADGAVETVLSEVIGESSQGFMAYTLPAEQPELEAGETYIWQVLMYCDPELETVGKWISAEMDIVEPADASRLNVAAESPVQKAESFAAAGFWFDAIAEVYDAETPEEKALRQNLLLDLADLEEDPNNVMAVQKSTFLREISELP